MKYIYRLSIVVLFFSFTGCKKYLDINTNPSVPQEAKAELLLAPIEYQMANGTSQDYRIIWKITQDMEGTSTDASSLNFEKHGFNPSSDVGGVIWRMTYVNLGLNLENMIKDAVDNDKYEYAGIGYAIKAWALQQTTDMHGPIILDEAYDPTRLSFPYHDQPDVYVKVREYGNMAIKYLNMTSPVDYSNVLASVSGDGIYKGDKAKWKKFVYALFALQYSHLRNKVDFGSKYADSVTKYVDLSFVDESESATVFFTATSDNDSNPLGPQFGYLASSITYYGRPGIPILNYLTGGLRGNATPDTTASIDPRLSRMLPSSTAAATLGVYQAITPGTGFNTPRVPLVYGSIPSGAFAYSGRFIFADAARYPLMTYSQLQLAKAEALLVKGNSSGAFTAYVNGIKGHMDFCNRYGRSYPSPQPVISSTETEAYLASNDVAKDASTLTIPDIMGQKYIVQWGWAAMEQWCDLRKYHYDPAVYRQYYQLTPGELVSYNKGKYAYRIRPRFNSEYVWNSAELDKWGGLDADYMTKETWFSLPND